MLDHTAHSTQLQATWVSGKPVSSRWTGIKLKGATQLPVETWRCRNCGYLESYARNNPNV